MPLPIILAGAAIAAAVYGVKKGIDAKSDFDAAESINADAQEILKNAQYSLEECRVETLSKMESLGRQKILLYKNVLTPLLGTFQQIRNFDYEEKNLHSDILSVQESTIHMDGVIGGTAGALGSGVFVGLAAYGSVGVFGTASTGTAIAGLSGAAATNATLAWLGGGSLAAGGFGMAGGAVVLGGIVAAPVLLVGGLMAASKAEEAIENALSNLSTAKGYAEDMKTAEVAARAVGRKATEVRKVLEQLQSHLDCDLSALQDLVSANLASANLDHRIRFRARKLLSKIPPPRNLISVNAEYHTRFAGVRWLLSKIPPLQNLIPADAEYRLRFAGIRKLLSKIPPLQNLISAKLVDYRTLSRSQKELVGRTIFLAITAKNVAEAPLLEEDGSIAKAIRETLRESRKFLQRLGEL